MQTQPEARIPKPESLEAKFKLLQMLPYDPRVRRKHCLVYGFILDWYHSKYGDALASVRHVVGTVKERDPFERGLYTGDVHSALTDLVAWGYLEQELGSGRRASRYIPVWSRSVHKNPNATDADHSVRETPNTSVRETPNTTGDSVRDSMNEDPSTLDPAKDRGTSVVEYDCAAPTAPLAAAPVGGATAGTAQEGFEELWRAYGVRKSKADARRAYDKLAPNAELHAQMLVSAHAWRDAAAGKVERMHLRRWIEEERYDEDPRSERKPRQHVAANENKPAKATNPTGPKVGYRDVDIIDSDVVTAGGETTLTLVFAERESDATWKRDIVIESSNQGREEEGRREFTDLCTACGIQTVQESSELHGPVSINVRPYGKIEYLTAATAQRRAAA